MISEIANQLALERAKSVEAVLRHYRLQCNSDEEFAQRMSSQTWVNKPGFVQYKFDDVPVFYTQTRFEDKCIKFILCPGSPDNSTMPESGTFQT